MAGFRLPFRHFDDVDRMAEALVQAAWTLPREEGSFYVFPGLLPMGLLPDLFRLEPEGMAARLKTAGRNLEKAYRALGRDVAKRLKGYVLPGSVLLPSRPGYRHLAVIFGPDGEALGEQSQTHALRDDVELAVSSSAATIPVGDLHVGILLGADAWAPEVSRVLALEGADLLVAPLAPRAPYTSEKALAGLWQMVQQNQVFGLETGLTGPLFETVVEGKLAFMGPCEITPGETGFLEEAGYFVGEGGRAVRMNPALLRRAREAYPLIRQLNPSLYRRYFPRPPGRDPE